MQYIAYIHTYQHPPVTPDVSYKFRRVSKHCKNNVGRVSERLKQVIVNVNLNIAVKPTAARDYIWI